MWFRVAAVGVVGLGGLLLAGASLAGCKTPEVGCRPGFVRAEDGHCYPPPPDPGPPTFNDAFGALEPCALLQAGEELDLAGGCIQGICAGDSFDEADETFGEGVSCESSGPDWDCNWPHGIAALFAPTDDDRGGPAPAARAYYMRARYLYEGATVDGLGIGVSVSCFVEAFGLPESASLIRVLGELVPLQLNWDTLGLEIEDEERALDLEPFPDGLVDEITLFGPP